MAHVFDFPSGWQGDTGLTRIAGTSQAVWVLGWNPTTGATSFIKFDGTGAATLVGNPDTGASRVFGLPDGSLVIAGTRTWHYADDTGWTGWGQDLRLSDQMAAPDGTIWGTSYVQNPDTGCWNDFRLGFLTPDGSTGVVDPPTWATPIQDRDCTNHGEMIPVITTSDGRVVVDLTAPDTGTLVEHTAIYDPVAHQWTEVPTGPAEASNNGNFSLGAVTGPDHLVWYCGNPDTYGQHRILKRWDPDTGITTSVTFPDCGTLAKDADRHMWTAFGGYYDQVNQAYSLYALVQYSVAR